MTTIGNFAFSGCSGLTSVTIPNSVTYIGHGTFRSCRKLQKIEVVSDNKNYMSAGGVLFTKDQKTLIQFPAGKTGVYSIPNSVTYIGGSAFFGCSGLTNVDIPNAVTTIGNLAFFSCTALENVYCAAVIPPTAEVYVFEEVLVADVTLHVPYGSKDAYATAAVWKDFGRIVEEEFDGIDEVPADAAQDGVDFELPYQVYDLNGKFLGNATDPLAPGIYIIRQETVVMKLAVN